MTGRNDRMIMREYRPGKKKGALIVETTIFLPIFILSVLTLSCLIRAVYLQVFAVETLADEGRKASVESYVFDHAVPTKTEDLTSLFVNAANRSVFEYKIQSGLEKRGIDAKEAELRSWERNMTLSGISGFTRAESVYRLKIALPVAGVDEISIRNILIFRVWEGEDLSGELFSFARMEQEEDGGVVCVFPNSGEKYHSRDCRYVSSHTREEKLTAGIRKKYDPCPMCGAREAEYGETVCLFQYGNSYHTSSCTSVNKYVIEMSLRDAQSKGYSACSVCGGKAA